MNTFKEAAQIVLQKAGKPLSAAEITKIALEEGLLETSGATPEATMAAQLYVDIKRRGKASHFTQTARGIFALNQKQQPIKPEKLAKVVEEEREEESKEIVKGSYTGKAGECLVCAELLFREFNASIQTVDEGVDIVAVKDKRMYGIQVKTANLNSQNTYNFTVRKVAFENNRAGNMFYVFVLRSEKKSSRFLIIPDALMEHFREQGKIGSTYKDTAYRVTVRERSNKITLGTLDNDVTPYLNNWDKIK